MFAFFKVLEIFVLRVLFSKEEYDINSKKFNPLKIISIIVLTLFPIITIYLHSKLSNAYVLITAVCPDITKDINKGKTRIEIIENLNKGKYIDCGLKGNI